MRTGHNFYNPNNSHPRQSLEQWVKHTRCQVLLPASASAAAAQHQVHKISPTHKRARHDTQSLNEASAHPRAMHHCINQYTQAMSQLVGHTLPTSSQQKVMHLHNKVYCSSAQAGTNAPVSASI